MILAVISLTLLLLGVSGYAVREVTHARADARRAIASVTPKPSIEIPARPARDMATLNARWVDEQEHILHPEKPLSFFNHRNCRACGPGPLGRYEVPSIYDHVMLGAEIFVSKGLYGGYRENPEVKNPREANIVSSRIEGSDYHTLMIDIDMPARLLPSSTPGCFHLYIDRPMLWPQYKAVLRALADAGVIEQAYYDFSVKNKETHLRAPWHDKVDS